MQLERTNSVQDRVKSVVIFLNLLINPNRFLLRDKTEEQRIRQDIRSSSRVRLVGKKIIYFFRTLFLVATDNIAIVASWIIVAQLSRIINESSLSFIEQSEINGTDWLVIMLVVNLSVFFSSGLYSTKDNSRRILDSLSACTISHAAFLVIVSILEKTFNLSFLVVLSITSVWLLSLLLIGLERYVLFQGINYVRKYFITLRRKIILVGVKEDNSSCLKLFQKSDTFDIVETLDLDSFSKNNDLLEEINHQIFSKEIDEVVICSWGKIKEQTKVFWTLQTSGISWRILPLKQSIPQLKPELADIEGIPTIRYATPVLMGVDFLVKRVSDLVIASCLLVILGIPMLFIGILVRLTSPGPIFYKQTRVGLKGELFKVWKFRTMVNNASQLQKELEAKNEFDGGILFKISEDPRITFIGKYLRRYSLDELPQLINVFKGEMSLVGPRPFPIRDVERFDSHHHFRHEILPGITGLWQVSGRSDASSDQVFKLDFQYIENWSLALDLKIMLKTFKVVMLGKGAY